MSTDQMTTKNINNNGPKNCTINSNYFVLPGLKHYWGFNGNLNDSIGNAHLYGGINKTFALNRFNSSYSALNLNGGYLDMPAGVYFNSNFALLTWVYPRKYANWARIFECGNGTNNNNIIFAYSKAFGGFPNFQIYNPIQYDLLSTLKLTLNTWQHLAFVLNNTKAYIFTNGNLTVQNLAFVSPANVVRINCFIGKSNWNTDELADANFDEMKIFDRALSQQEIINEMNNDFCV